ncbi:polymorphic toxin-type HINT domain-containing protein [Streptomyces sp. NPDC020965]|uniref:polymorphic toxin-type HINT domain-containing protein n=1 Tax=Streptomyces sp. NPDC020965 TaxID=3365105 RepID=UPI0037894BD1
MVGGRATGSVVGRTAGPDMPLMMRSLPISLSRCLPGARLSAGRDERRMKRRVHEPGIAAKAIRAIQVPSLGLLSLTLVVSLLGSPAAGTGQAPPNPAAGSVAIAPTDRSRVVEHWKAGGPGVKAAAEAALTGSDTEVQAFLAAVEDLSFQDVRVGAVQLSGLGGTELLAAARAALSGTPGELWSFVGWGWKGPIKQDNRVRAAQIISTAGPAVQDAGRAALNGTAADVSKFLTTGQHTQQEQDERVRLVQLISVGGTNVRAAGRLALRGGAQEVRTFLEVGQFVARDKDQEHTTVAQLAAQAKEAGRQAAKETDAAKATSVKAVESAQLAKEAALRAAAEAEAAKNDTDKAGRAAGRAAKAASQAAAAAQEAIEASRAANNSARVAANAAAQAAAAASGAAQAASRARHAAANAAVDAQNAAAAREAAENARDAAKGADLAADAADEASKAASSAGDAARSAASAGVNANLAANAASEASTWAGQSSAAAAEARAAAAATKRHANEANRAAAAAENLSREAATAAAESRDAAREAATHARNAATAADDAAQHAGDAATAAAKSTEHANAATHAANAATSAVLRAQKIYTLARRVETLELEGRTNAGIERAKDQKEATEARTARRTAAEQAAQDREAERNRLVTEAAQPGADLTALAVQGRALAVKVMKNGTAWGRATAEAALAGPDVVVIDYLRSGWRTAKEQDERSHVERIAEEDESKEMRDAAEAALLGDAAAVTAFITTGRHQVASQPMRVEIARIIDGAGPVLAEEGRRALDSGDPKKYSDFFVRSQNIARTQDERVRAAHLVDSGTPELKSAARIALEGAPQTLHTFIASGQHIAQRKDHLTGAHVARVQKLIAEAAKIAAIAQQNAATAQKVAATARNAAAEAAEWARKAGASATEAQGHASRAAQHALDAEASANSAAASAATARTAANQANTAAEDAARSAADATLSSEIAQTSASSAWFAADRARQSAIAAGKDAAASLAAASEALTISIQKYRQEEEARRKAAVEKKQKDIKDIAGARARAIYRCSSMAPMPCDPPAFARWCQHNEIECQLFSDVLKHADEINSTIDRAWGAAKDLTGLGQLEACMEEKDLENCSGLAADVLIGAKLKALEKSYNALKVLKRNCNKCFPPGTKVLMGDGSRKNIEDIRLGDKVLATDPVARLTGVREVTRLIVTEDDKQFNKLTIETPSGPAKLTATQEHPFWSPSQQDWVEAHALKPGMTLQSSDNSAVRIRENRSFTQRQTTYNLSVADIHTYYVLAGRMPVLVHNSGGEWCTPEERLEDASDIGNGHAGSKHAGDFPGYSPKDIGDLVRDVMQNPARSKPLGSGRRAYQGKDGSTIVIHDPMNPDGGTIFRRDPGTIDDYWNELN